MSDHQQPQNVIQGATQVAGGFVEALKREPLSLALVLMNLALLLFFYVLLDRVATQRKDEIALLYSDHKEVRELLSKCIVPKLQSSPVFKFPPITPTKESGQ